MNADATKPTFPWRDILTGAATGWDVPTLRAQCGEPDQSSADGNGGAILVYRSQRPDPAALGDPRTTEVQAWVMGGRVALVALRLDFADGLTYDEVIGRDSIGA